MSARAPRVAVVGAGFAGLAAALRLAAAGAAVTVVERAERPGGKAGEWRAGGFRFDTGPTVFTLPEVVEATFEAAGRPCPLELEAGDGACRYVFPSGRVWDVSTDLERTLSGLDAAEGAIYRRALAKARALYEAAAPTFVHGPPPSLAQLAAYGLRHGLAAAPGRSLPQLLDALGVGGDLRPFFLRFATYFGADPRRAPAVLHNIAWVELGLGTRHVRGGMHAVARALAEAAADLGVEFRYGEAALAVERRGGRVVAIDAEHGRVPCDGAVLAIDRRQALALLGRPPAREPEPSLSGLVWLAGVKGSDDRLARHTILFPEAYGDEFDDVAEGRAPRDPTLYVSISSRSHPEDAPSGCDNLFVMANAPALPVVAAPEGRARWMREGRQVIEGTLARRGFAPREEPLVERLLTPHDYAAFGHRGALYGAAPHGLRGALRAGHRVRGVRDVVLAGGTVHPGGGVPLALLSGGQAATRLARDLALHRG
jgi:phytoene desaturase